MEEGKRESEKGEKRECGRGKERVRKGKRESVEGEKRE